MLVCGVFGNISDADIAHVVGRLPELCAPGASVLWTRHRLEPDLTPSIREWFEQAGFEETGFEAPEGTIVSVGANRLRGDPRPLERGVRLFRLRRLRGAPGVSYRAGLVLLLLAGLVLRLIGVGWGLPGRSAPDEPPFHPDEHVVWKAAETLYSAPPPSAFVYGGAFYARTGWLMRAGVHASAATQPPRDYAATLVGLRLLNAGAALVSAALLAAITRRLLGAAPALGAVALYLFFPVTVLDAHYARPDVLAAALTTASLAAAVAMARTGDRRWLALGGVCTGLATATLLSGVVGLAPLAVAALEWERGKAGARWWQSGLRAAPFAAGGALAGWLFGNLEALLHLEAWRSGLAIASSSHNEGGWALPIAQLTRVSLYAFGSAAALAGYAGIPVLIASRARGSLTVVAHLVFGYVLLARIGGDMMRHQEILAAPMALAAAAALAARDASGRGAERARCHSRGSGPHGGPLAPALADLRVAASVLRRPA